MAPTQLPPDVQEKIDAVFIPQIKDWDRNDVYLRMVYQMLPYEQLLNAPDYASRYEMTYGEMMEVEKV